MINSLFVLAAAMMHSALAATLNPMTTVASSRGVLKTTIDVDQYFFEEVNTGTKLWTRAYNPPTVSGNTLHPGPVLRFRRGDTVTVTLNNNLGPETVIATDMNSYHYANTTNLHTHGLHISAESPQDNVMITILPQDSFTYIYEIPDDHAAGTFWYHAHHHGSTAIQVGGGLVGVLIVEDEDEDLPPAFVNMPEVILLMSDTPVSDLIENYVCTTGDDLFMSPDNVYPPGDDFVLVNGQYQPTGSVVQGEWTRLRTIFSGLKVALELQMTSNTAECEWFLLAKDGVYVEGAPRALGDTVFLGPGNRADVVMRCSSSGEVVLGSTNTADDQAQQSNIVTLTVESSSSGTDTSEDLPIFTPYRPDYLADLYTSTNTSTFELSFGKGGGGCTINGGSWDGSTALGTIETGSIQEWTVSGASKHPYHLHVNSYQLKGATDASGYYADGDWQDVLYPPSGVTVEHTMFAVDSYVTKSIIHCHFLPHEDMGCMGYMQHTGSHGATTGLVGHGMWCLGPSTGEAVYNSNCTVVSS